jgi:hypothetical protein
MTPQYDRNDRLAAQLYRAIALRFYIRHLNMRLLAQSFGGDLPNAEPVGSLRDIAEKYRREVGAALLEPVETIAAARAAAALAAIIAADKLVTVATGDAPVIDDESDMLHQIQALGEVGAFLNWLEIDQMSRSCGIERRP